MADEHDQPEGVGLPELDEIDRLMRANELAERARELGAVDASIDPDCPPEHADAFLRNLIAYDSSPLISYFERLVRGGVDLPHPDAMDDAALTAKLWEVIGALAAQHTYLSRTDHMSDRALYEELWHDTLREEHPDMPLDSGWVWHLDMLGSGSEADIENSLRYYDTPEERQRWAEEFPGDHIPAHVDPPFDRDRHLPRDESGMLSDDAGDEPDDEDESQATW